MIPLLRRTVQAGSIPAAIRDNLLDCYSNNSRRFLRLYFYPRSPCGERPGAVLAGIAAPLISIHALLAESDWPVILRPAASCHFYPRSPCGERRKAFARFAGTSQFLATLSLRRATPCAPTISFQRGRFLSTLSLRRATGNPARRPTGRRHFYPRSPCGERPFVMPFFAVFEVISIHALLAESDGGCKGVWTWKTAFLSTLSLRRATPVPAPLGAACRYFYPRSPCGERLRKSAIARATATFLSTLSLRRATQQHNGLFGVVLFLSTLSLRRATALQKVYKVSCGFLSTLSLRRATVVDVRRATGTAISIHALLAESDGCRCPPRHWHGGFLSTLSLRRATCQWRRSLKMYGISIHALLAESDKENTLHLYSSTDFYPRSPCGERPDLWPC